MKYEVNTFHITKNANTEEEAKRIAKELFESGINYVEVDRVYEGETFTKYESVVIFSR